jgi:hypothetical protein
VISTAFGARGLGVQPGEHYFAAEPPDFGPLLARIRRLDPAELQAVVKAARTVVEERLSWTVIADDLLARLREDVSDPAPERQPPRQVADR